MRALARVISSVAVCVAIAWVLTAVVGRPQLGRHLAELQRAQGVACRFVPSWDANYYGPCIVEARARLPLVVLCRVNRAWPEGGRQFFAREYLWLFGVRVPLGSELEWRIVP